VRGYIVFGLKLSLNVPNSNMYPYKFTKSNFAIPVWNCSPLRFLIKIIDSNSLDCITLYRRYKNYFLIANSALEM